MSRPGKRNLVVAVFDHAHFLAHAPLANHSARNRRSHFDIAARAVSDVAEDDFLRDAAAHANCKTGEQFVFAVGVFIFLGQPHGGSERGAARNDGDLVQRFGVRKKFEQQRVTRFVVSGVLLFFFAERKTSALLAPANFVARFFQFGERDPL